WMDGLVETACEDPASTAAAGPLSNYAAGAQHIAVDYTDLSGLARFSDNHRQHSDAGSRAGDRLRSFCMLMNRTAIEKVGLLDERFGIGLFDDDDWCARARRAGLRLLIAPQVFVHHFGGRTFKTLGIDLPAQLERSRQLFREKWGPA